MIGLLKSENRKFTSTRMTWILLGSTIALSLTYVLSYALMAGLDMGSGVMIPGLESELTVRLVFSSIAMGGYVIPIVLGIIASTSELRYRTLTLTYLTAPVRWKTIAAKFVVSFIWGAIFGLIDLLISLPTAIILINSKPHWTMPTENITSISIGTIFGFALYAALGVALGSLLRNQIAAIVGTLTWVLIVESIFMMLLPDFAKWLPGGAIAAMSENRSLSGQEFLSPAEGGWLLLAYALAIGIIAIFTTKRQDVS